MDQDVLFSVVGFLAVTVLLYLYTKKKYQDNWQGTVTKIEYFNKSNDRTSDEDQVSHPKPYVRIKYKKDSGQKGKFVITQEQFNAMFSSLNIGDKLIKKKGDFYPGSPGY